MRRASGPYDGPNGVAHLHGLRVAVHHDHGKRLVNP